MKFIGFTMVKNEEDILEQFVRHNLHFLDRLYIFDHGSSDSTMDILRALASEGLPVVSVNAASSTFVGYAQAEIMSSILQLCIRDNGAGTYFPMDADEFIHFQADLNTLKQEIADISAQAFNIAYMNMPYPGAHDAALHQDVPKSFNLLGKWEAMSGHNMKAAVRVDDPTLFGHYQVTQGNHQIAFNGSVLAKSEHFDALRYIHVPVRSSEHAFRKFVIGWLANVQKYGKDTRAANHWKLAFDLICKEQDYAKIDCTRLIEGLYHGPAVLGNEFELVDATPLFHYELKYAHLRQPGLGVIFRSMESDLDAMAREIVRLRGA